MDSYTGIGVMSGTSIDGLDIALCSFQKDQSSWKFQILGAKTYPYEDNWKLFLNSARNLNAYQFIKLHKTYGSYIGDKILLFLSDYKKVNINFISTHGHTIFHRPSEKITYQLGDGASVAAKCGISTISDFRNLDVELGGQGAPLVPIGDKLLFNDFEICLNLGGFANISYDNELQQRIAFDICPVNIITNHLAHSLKYDFDKGGRLGKKGKVNQQLLEKLNNLKYYSQKPPKSLGREWLEYEFLPVINSFDISIVDKLRTVYEHIAIQIYMITRLHPDKKMLVTGGGSFNTFLIEVMKKYSQTEIIIPDKVIVEFKEALIFAFLGVLRLRKEVNCLSSVTGARNDNIGGSIFEIEKL